MHVAMAGAIWQGLQTQNKVVLANENPTYFEPIVLYQENPSPEDLIREFFGDDWHIALAIAKAESTMRADKCHIDEREYSCGLFQINLRAHYKKVPGTGFEEKAEWLKIPENNIKMAKKLYDKSGWWPWSVYKNGSYELYL